MKVCMIVPNAMVKGGIASVVNGYRGSPLEKEYEVAYIESYCDGTKLKKLLKGITGYGHFLKQIFTNRPDLVHIHSSFGPSFYRKLPFIYMASWAGIPVINHIHGAQWDVFYEDTNEVKQRLIQRVYGKCSALIALSEEWRVRLCQVTSGDKIYVIENYSQLHRDALEARLQRKNSHTILFLGELGKRKGCYDIPAVVAEVVKAVPDVCFVLAGAGNENEEDAIREVFRDMGVQDHVRFPGWVRGKERDLLLRNADIFFLPSYNEGMPMSVLDAMGYGLPIISTDVGGIPQIVRNGENGYCFMPGDITGMSRAILEVLQDESKRRKFAQGSFRISSREYGMQAHMDKLFALYANTCTENKQHI